VSKLRIKLGDKDSARDIAEDILQEILDRVRHSKKIDRMALTGPLRTAIREGYVQGVNWAIKNMIGVTAPRGIGTVKQFNSFGTTISKEEGGVAPPKGPLLWDTLANSTVNRKMEAGRTYKDAASFFVDTGNLRSKLQRMVRGMVNNTGVVAIRTDERRVRELNSKTNRLRLVRQRRDKVTLDDITIRLLPRVPLSLLPGISARHFGVTDPDQGFEQLLIHDPDVLEKLKGPGDGHVAQRPFLQPVFTYWTLYHIPNTIQKTIRKILK
jgi:hypothetical protein